MSASFAGLKSLAGKIISPFFIWSGRFWLWSLLLVTISIGLDQYSKRVFTQYFFGPTQSYEAITSGKIQPEPINPKIPLVKNIISVEFALNKGIALSLPLHGTLRNLVTIIGTLIVFVLFLVSIQKNALQGEQIGYLFILGGAISNGFDRVIYGQVTDFINLHHFAICNIADFFISTGVILLLYHTIRNQTPIYEPRK